MMAERIRVVNNHDSIFIGTVIGFARYSDITRLIVAWDATDDTPGHIEEISMYEVTVIKA
jgi:hypothetical protein